MAQVQTVAPTDDRILGLDPSLSMPADPDIVLRKWGPRILALGALAAGGVFAYTMPALNLNDGTTLSINDVNQVMTFSTPSRGWVLPLSWFSGVFAILMLLVMPNSERFARTIGASIGTIGALIFPYFVATRQSWVDEKASGLGSGLTATIICFFIALLIPWLDLLLVNRQSPVLGFGWSRWLFVGPAVLWILLLTAFPLVYAITTSRYGFRNGRIARPVQWDNYKRAFADADWAQGFQEAFTWALVAIVAVVVIGLIMAFVSNEFSFDPKAIRAIASFIPVLAIPALVIGLLTSVLADPLDNQLGITVYFVVGVVAIEMILGMLFALLMNRDIKGRSGLRAILTLPLFAAPVGIGYLARTIFYEGGGPADRFLEKIGINPPPWLSDPTWARFTTMIVDVWQWTPFVFVIALAGLQGLPHDIVEAAEVDGASKFHVFRTITLPLMAPILWLILLLRTIDAFKVFDIAASMTLGGPGRATEYYSLFNYRTARKYFDYGYAAVQAFILLFVVAVIVTVLWGRIKGIYEEEVIQA